MGGWEGERWRMMKLGGRSRGRGRDGLMLLNWDGWHCYLLS